MCIIKKCFLKFKFLIILLMTLECTILNAQNNSSLRGKVIDVVSGEGLPGANIIVVGTGMGAATDIYGNYVIKNLPADSLTIRISYIGYKAVEMQILTVSNEAKEMDFKLAYESVKGEEIVITAQVKGQTEAINQQLTSKAIVNIVSSSKIQELPDQNAAESIGRLPGVSVLREGGEGNKIVIRGLSPKYNNIEVAGVKMAATGSNDRSVDLSMISPYILEGIEVTKAITPDMDADAIGGTVNFKLRQAPKGLKYDFLVQGGYSGLKQTYDNYRVIGGGSNRFFDGQLGLFAQLDIEGKNNSSHEMGADYEVIAPISGKINSTHITSLNLYNMNRYLNRYGGTIVLDYDLSNGSIILNNFFSSVKTKTQKRSEYYHTNFYTHLYDLEDKKTDLDVMTNSVKYVQDFSLFKIEADLAHSYSHQTVPMDLLYSFQETDAFRNFPQSVSPEALPGFAKNNFSNAILATINDFDWENKDREITASANLSRGFNLSQEIFATFKIGGRYGYKDRSYDYNAYTCELQYTSNQEVRNDIIAAFPWMQNTVSTGALKLPYTLFIDNDYDFGEFIGGEYKPWAVPDLDLMNSIHNVIQKYKGSRSFFLDDVTSVSPRYSGNEYLTAGYLMGDFEYGSSVSLITGVRYEQVQRDYTAPRGDQTIGLPQYRYIHRDTTTSVTNINWLPMVQIKYKPFDWFDVRFAYTNTLSRPDFSSITPKMSIGVTSVTMNDYKLKPAHSENFDLYFSFHENTIGLLTIGGFKKTIDNMIFATNGKIILDPLSLGLRSSLAGLSLYSFINNPNPVDLWGIEASWQTHFWYLPGLLKGIVLDVNYTHTYSEAKYPRTISYFKPLTEPPWIIQTVVDTFYTSRMIDQPDNIINVSLGYDYKDFSTRVSFVYHSNIFIAANFWPELRQYTSDYRRFDLSFKQKLPWYGLEVFLNVINITEAKDKNVVSISEFPTSEQYYGRGIDLGIRYRME